MTKRNGIGRHGFSRRLWRCTVVVLLGWPEKRSFTNATEGRVDDLNDLDDVLVVPAGERFRGALEKGGAGPGHA